MALVKPVGPVIFLIDVGGQLTDDDVLKYIDVFGQNIKDGTSFSWARL